MSKRARSSNRLNPIALLATLAMVAASVVVGVFGPRLSERAQGPLVPLGDLVAQARDVQARLQFETLHRPTTSANPTREVLAELCERALLGAWRPPDLAADGFVLVCAQATELEQSHAAVALLYERAGETPDRFLALFATADHTQFASFDEFGRIEPFAVGRTIVESDDATNPLSSASIAWSDGTLFLLARVDTTESLDSLRTALGAP